MYQDLFSLKNNNIIITGGTGHLGFEITKALAENGANVTALGRNKESLAALNNYNQELESPACGKINAMELDIMDTQSFTSFMKEYIQENKQINCFINNALSAGREPLDELNNDLFLKGFEGSFMHVFANTKTVGNYMKKQKSGSIISNASIFGFLSPNPDVYLDLNNQPSLHLAVGKAGILQMTKFLASEWGKEGVRVNCVSPGFVPKKRGPERPDYIKQLTSRIPMDRIASKDEVPGAFIYLASKASSYLTGQNLIVDGGYSIW